ncbi:hypothetical protein SAMN06297251_102126 [Fulvimarina manganoxydans]|uniref:AAA domain-containing protein n=1 Tax=Fulvimarina manganoxydans TaxID=937218 RepID=A0A1W1Z3F6_9HYPH|nr:ATP-binding protein [Fulvimarina manganoxydans]SMC42916.1 hypothetical protein SAMN06297251_102126 [Fulvimarina manganoxydans]
MDDQRDGLTLLERAQLRKVEAEAALLELQIKKEGGDLIDLTEAENLLRPCGDNDGNKCSLADFLNPKRTPAYPAAEEALFDLGVRMIIITGDAGTGKSTLMMHLSRLAALSGPAVCLYPTMSAANAAEKLAGQFHGATFDVSGAPIARPCKTIFIEDWTTQAQDSTEGDLVDLCMKRVDSYCGGKVVVIANERFQFSCLRLIKPVCTRIISMPSGHVASF